MIAESITSTGRTGVSVESQAPLLAQRGEERRSIGIDRWYRRAGIASFDVEGVHPHDVAQILDWEGVAVRAGHHCAAPLHQKLGIAASNRISIGLYNNKNDIDRFIAALKEIIEDISHA